MIFSALLDITVMINPVHSIVVSTSFQGRGYVFSEYSDLRIDIVGVIGAKSTVLSGLLPKVNVMSSLELI